MEIKLRERHLTAAVMAASAAINSLQRKGIITEEQNIEFYADFAEHLSDLISGKAIVNAVDKAITMRLSGNDEWAVRFNNSVLKGLEEIEPQHELNGYKE